jgi:flagellar biosynthetic protein FlhB
MADTDRQLPATERKLRQAREEGQVARSRDLGHLAAVAGGFALLATLARPLADRLNGLLTQALRFDAASLRDPALMGERLAGTVLQALLLVLPLGGALMVLAVAAGVLSGGWNWTFKPLKPKFDKLNPLPGLGRLVSAQQLIDTLKAVLLASVIGTVGVLYLNAQLPSFAGALAMPLPEAFAHVLGRIESGVWLLVLALALFAAVDVPLQRFQHGKRLRMSHQEVKREHKEQEGNVEVKAKLRAKMRELVKRRMMAEVPKADLVVMNPTHYAVALKYDEGKMAAPRVVAKGADLLALRIRDLARESKVPVLQAPALARALYAHAQLDREIPAALFGAVAQVLAYVYQLRAALAGRAPVPTEAPVPSVPDELDPHHAQAQKPTADDADDLVE